MQRLLRAIAVLVAGVAVTRPAAAPREGRLVLVGGGPTPAIVFTRTLEISGGRAARVAVLPQTYPNDSIADTAVAMWKQFGVRDVEKVSRTDAVAAHDALERATLIWMPGGFQGYLMKTLEGTMIPDQIRARFAAGVTIGGASAGAAAMSRVMVADETAPDGTGVDGPVTGQGLGLWPEAIVSPHFNERQRMNPLMAILRVHPGSIGVGIDEGTAVIVSSGECEIVGRGTAVIVEKNGASVRALKQGARFRSR